MTQASMSRLRESYRGIAPRFGHVADRFYERLFAAEPSTRDLFRIDMTTQAGHLSAALALIVRNLSMLDALEGPLMELGAAHARVGVRPEHYPVACDALLASLGEAIGGNWSAELSNDWRALLDRIAGQMLAGTLPDESAST
jgi:hemoglobin-like flavoprotein